MTNTIMSFPIIAIGLLVTMFGGVRAEVALQPNSYLDYVPNLSGNAIVGALYALFTVVLFGHLFFTGPKVDKWALTLPIGTFFAALGYFLRLPMRTSQHNMPLYTVMYLFVVLSPAAFLAFMYILYGRFSAALEGHKPSEVKRKSRYSFLPPRWIKIIFVTSDVVTFCIQAAGGGMQTSEDYNTVKTGNTTFLVGVAAQGASYLLFTALALVTHARLLHRFGRRFSPLNVREPAVILLNMLYISSIGILVRSAYRIVEMSQGYGGYLYSNEIFTFTLDALPLLIATGIYAAYWPGILLHKVRHRAAQHEDDDDSTAAAAVSADDRVEKAAPTLRRPSTNAADDVDASADTSPRNESPTTEAHHA